jgi:hypothetical protein
MIRSNSGLVDKQILYFEEVSGNVYWAYGQILKEIRNNVTPEACGQMYFSYLLM